MIYQFKIQLKKVSKPTVWRRVQVNGDHSLDIFHEIIQACFGWENYHSYQFSPKGWGSYPVYSLDDEPEEEFEGLEEDSREHRIKDVFNSINQKMIYFYDFGDDWQHQITLENIEEGSLKEPFLADGKGSCPPEDCGGPYMYSDMISNGDFEPEDFNLKETRAYLSEIYRELSQLF